MKNRVRLNAYFYVYVIFYSNGVPCYVGKGHGYRCYIHKKKGSHNTHLDRLLKQAKGRLPVIIVRGNLTEKEAFALEIELIRIIGRHDKKLGPLVNHTDGGEGGVGVIGQPTPQFLRATAGTFWWHTSDGESYRSLLPRNSSDSRGRGRDFSATNSAAQRTTKRVITEETRQKWKRSRAGWKRPHLLKLNVERLGKPGFIPDEETRRKMSKAQLKRGKRSDIVRKNMSKSALLRWAKHRGES